MKNTTAVILLFLANSISGMAQGISMIAIPWYFAQQEKMASFALVYILTNLISLFWIPYSGAMIDRYNRRKIFLFLTTICGTIILLIGTLGIYLDGLPWQFVAAVFILTFLNYAVHYPNLYAFVQEIIEPEYYGRITSYLEIQGQLTSILAGAGAAFLLEGTTEGTFHFLGSVWEWPFTINAWDIHEIFLLDASTYFISFLIIWFIRHESLHSRENERGGIWSELKTGYQYLRENPYLFLFGVASYTVFVTVLLQAFFLGALYVNEHLQASGNVYASSEIFYAVGAVFSGLAIRKIFGKVSPPLGIIIMTFITAFLFLTLAIGKSVWLFFMMLLVLGITNAGIRILRTTYLFSIIPNQVFGRAISIFNLSNILFRIFFLAIFSISFFQTGVGVVYTFYILGGFLFIAGAVLLWYKSRFKQL